MPRGARLDVGDLLRHGLGWFAPGQVHVELFGGQFVRGLRRTAEIQRRIRLLHRRVDHLAALGHQLLALEAVALGLMAVCQDAAPDAQVVGGDGVAFVVADEDAIALQLAGVAAGHHVDQQPPFGQAVEGGGHARRELRRADAGADRHQELEPARGADQAGGHHPRILAGAPGGQQHAVVAQRVGGHRHLAEVVIARRARAAAGAEITRIAVGGNEPEDVHGMPALVYFRPDGAASNTLRGLGISLSAWNASATCCCSSSTSRVIGCTP